MPALFARWLAGDCSWSRAAPSAPGVASCTRSHWTRLGGFGGCWSAGRYKFPPRPPVQPKVAVGVSPRAKLSWETITMASVERVHVVRDGHWSARTISILAALAVDAGLIWLLL